MRAARAFRVMLLLAAAAAALAAPAPTLSRAGKAGTSTRWQLSSHSCPPPVVPHVTDASPRTCTFRNLYLWRGRAYYLTQGAPPRIDQLGLDFEFWRGSKQPRVSPDFVTVLTPARFSELLISSSGGGGGSGGSGVREIPILEHTPLVYFWRARKVRRDVARGATCDGTSHIPGKSNYYHFLAEHLVILHATLCEQFGHCQQYRERGKLRIIDVTPAAHYPCHLHEAYPPFYHEALACLSSQPLHHINGSTLGGRLTLVETAWMGLGPRCRGIVSGCYPKKRDLVGGPRLPPTPELMAGFRSTMAQCLGFPADPPAQLHPVRVLVVDRLYESNRHILNIASVMRALRSHFHPQQVQLRLEYLEGMNIRQQAQLYSWATVLVAMHGAAFGNYLFLPRGAVAIHLAPIRHRWHVAFAMQLAHDLAGVTDISVHHWANPDPRRVHLLTELVDDLIANQPVAAQLVSNKTFMDGFLATFDCPKHLPPDLHHACYEGLQRAINVAFPPDQIVNMTEAAIAAAFGQQQQQWQPLGGVGDGGGGTAQLLPPVLRPSRVWLYALAASGMCVLCWVAVLQPLMREQIAAAGRRPP